jgi:hypothetical protein
VEKLQALKQLKRLDLHGAKRVADNVAPVLAAMPSLEWVDLFETGVTPAARETLRKSRTNLTVLP